MINHVAEPSLRARSWWTWSARATSRARAHDGAEDFSYFCSRSRCVFLIGNGEGTIASQATRRVPCMLTPHYDFNERADPLGATLWVRWPRSG